jgi:hypothetical protein
VTGTGCWADGHLDTAPETDRDCALALIGQRPFRLGSGTALAHQAPSVLQRVADWPAYIDYPVTVIGEDVHGSRP